MAPVRRPGGRPALAFLVALLSLPGLDGCRRGGQRALFERLTPERTGVTFANTITTGDSLNVQTDVFVYNGGGAAIGDIDNDGLPDLYFTGNMVSSRLYLNRGDMRFADITQSAGVKTDRWATGVTMVDINSDGYLDIYVCVSGPAWSTGRDRTNLLFLNNGDRTFTEAAARFGIADSGFTTQAAFLDYDGDGDLDLFLLGDSPEEFARGEANRNPLGVRSTSTGSYDQLYRNNGDGTFTNVSREAGILAEVGYGLGVAVADLNRDGRPDIYVSNDEAPDDVLYVNNGDGTFTDEAATWLKHTSFAGMGVDIADFNNDGWPDILQADMMPAALSARKRMSGSTTLTDVAEAGRRGFAPGYTLNSLQLSNGVGEREGGDVHFSEIARLAGVAYTDWSWATLFADLDNDGHKDILITNGYPKAVTDYDYQTAMYRARRAGDSATVARKQREILAQLPGLRVSNYLFRNDGDLTFTDVTRAWGMDEPGYSYGAAYGDLDNDGRLDVVINNIDAPASIYWNTQRPDSAHHYLAIRLLGDSPNARGIGATLVVTTGERKQYAYQSPTRGYLSGMDDRLHFGLGGAVRVDTLQVIWPDGRAQVLSGVAADQLVTLRQAEARQGPGAGCRVPGCPARHPAPDTRHPPFERMDPRRAPAYLDQAGAAFDYSVQPLLPNLLSAHGPPLAVADVDGDGLDDVFIGGGAGVPGRLFLQRPGGRFVESTRGQPWAADSSYEDWGALFFDADGDGRPDLYVASGGYRLSPVSRWLQDRLYRNRGGGRFARDTAALPAMPTSTASVAAGDFTGDGRADLFVGGRLVPRNYPYPARSYLLRNDGARFTDVTAQVAPSLAQPAGMVTAAVWVDLDGDGRPDLVTAGEWMPIRVFRNEGARLRDVTDSAGLARSRGWWYSLAAGDFDHDGHPDLVAGNLGLNYTFTTAPGSRFGIYAADFTGNRVTDIVLTQEVDGTDYPVFGFAKLGEAIYTVGLRFLTYRAFSEASIAQIFSPAQLQGALHYQADTFASVYLQNDGSGRLRSFPLPNLAQLSPIRGIVVHDVDGDGNLDLVVAGNLYDAEPNTPRADAGNGLWLRGDGRGHFTPVPPQASGFLAPLDVTGLALVKTPAGSAVFVANNGDSLQAFTLRRR